jgi:hypothetical protein
MSDWMPGKRANQLAMCHTWITTMTAETRTAWGIPQVQFDTLLDLFGTAQGLFQKTRSGERTPVITAMCRGAFDALDGRMRFFKGRYFLTPPLSNADIVGLGLTPRGSAAPVPRPEAQVEADLTFPGIHLVELRNIRAVTSFDLPDPRSEYGVRIFYGLSGDPTDNHRFRVTGTPKTGRDLPYSIFTRRKKELFDFDGESGNRVYFCLRYENARGGRDGEGPFGPILTAVIP